MLLINIYRGKWFGNDFNDFMTSKFPKMTLV